MDSAESSNSLEHLDDFNLLAIFDHLKLSDLLAIGSVNHRFRDLVARHFIIPKFGLNDREIMILADKNVYLGENDVDDEPISYTVGLHRTLTVLQTFGHIFERLDIRIRPNGYKFIGEIASVINRYCSKAVQKVTLFRGNGITSDSPFSFENATILRIRHISATGYKETLRIDAAFPLLQEIDIDYGSDLTFLHQYMPNMRHLALLSSYSNDDETHLLEFFRLNGQLRSLRTPMFYKLSYLHAVSQLLPDLESLVIKNLNTHVYVRDSATRHTAHFKNVRHFTLDLFTYNCKWNGALRDRLDVIEFDNLDTISVTSNVDNSEDYLIGLIVRNAAVRRVELPSTELDGDQLMRLLAGMKELDELTMSWSDRSTRDVLWQFMSDALDSKLQKLNVLALENGELRVSDIVETVPAGWKHSGNRRFRSMDMARFERIGSNVADRV